MQKEERAVKSSPKVARRRKKSFLDLLRFIGIAAKVIFEELCLFFKRLYTRNAVRTVAVTAVICVVGLAAIISVAAAASRKDDDSAADAILAPKSGQVVAAEGDGVSEDKKEPEKTESPQTDSVVTEDESYTDSEGKDHLSQPVETQPAPPQTTDSEASDTEAVDDEVVTEETTEESAETEEEVLPDAGEDEAEKKEMNTVTVTFWDRESIVLESDADTVGEFIIQANLELSEIQCANINPDIPIAGDITICVDAVTYDKVVVEETLSFETEYRESSAYPAGTSQITQYGVDGSQSREFTVTYVNGIEVEREQTGSWIDSYPTNQIITNGTGSQSSEDSEMTPGEPSSPGAPEGGGTFVGADGVEREYLYYIDVRATCYYVGGTTASGLPADESVIAVDPSVIPLGTTVYVAGSYGDFGVRIAADTGGNIKGNVIDVCIDPNHPLAGTFGWRDMRVYILA